MATSKNHNYNQIGKDIEAAVKEGIISGNWGKLNTTISSSVDAVIDDTKNIVKESVANGLNAKNLSSHEEFYSDGEYTRKRQQQLYEERKARNAARQKAREREAQMQKANQARPVAVKPKKNEIMVPINRIGSVSSVVCIATGTIGISITAISLLKSIPAYILGSASWGNFIVSLGAMAVFGLIINKGIASSKRLSLAERIARQSGNKEYIEIDDIAGSMGRPRKRVIRDIKKLLRLGFYPEGHLDDDNSNLIFTNATYKQYLQTKKAAAVVDTTARVIEKSKYEGLNDEESAELDQMIDEGNSYIVKLHELNENIPGEVITEKLYQLEDLLRDIFKGVEKHPEQMGKMHELMEYYLPTVLKLVTAYEEYDKVSSPSESIISAKKDIEDTIDTINIAFRKLLNNLFKDSVWDVTTDAQVLKTVLAQKGLATGMEGDNNE